MAAIVWLVLGFVFAIAEAFSMTFVLIMFAAGAFAAAAAAALGAPPVLQAIVFGVVSALALVAARPALRGHLATGGGDQKMGVAALEGASALVLETVDTDRGLIKIEGETWTARSYDSTQTFEPGEHVHVIKIKGATALVWRD